MNKDMTFKHISLAAAVLTLSAAALTACDFTETEEQPWDGRIILCSDLGSIEAGETQQTRATTAPHITTQGSNTVFAEGKYVDIFISERTNISSEVLYKGERYYLKTTAPSGTSASGVGNFQFVTAQNGSTSVIKYWPASGNDLYFYAYYPTGQLKLNGESDYITSTTATKRTFTCAADQGAAGAAELNDLMFGVPSAYPIGTAKTNPIPRPTGKEKANHFINLNFKHCLSKVVVILKGDGYGLTDAGVDQFNVNQLTQAVVTLGTDNSMFLQASVTPNSGEATNKTDGTKGIFTLKSKTEPSLENYCIIPPGQTLTGKKIKIVTTSGGSIEYEIPKNGNATVTAQAGKTYTYTVTIGLFEVSVTSTISDWTQDASGSGTLII